MINLELVLDVVADELEDAEPGWTVETMDRRPDGSILVEVRDRAGDTAELLIRRGGTTAAANA